MNEQVTQIFATVGIVATFVAVVAITVRTLWWRADVSDRLNSLERWRTREDYKRNP